MIGGSEGNFIRIILQVETKKYFTDKVFLSPVQPAAAQRAKDLSNFFFIKVLFSLKNPHPTEDRAV